MTAMGVSRTVVREAVAALRADGLVTTRQGSGAYVAADVSRVPFRIDPEGLSSIDDVLAVMELRQAIEVEAAALAAERITPRRLAPIVARAARHRGRHSQGRRRRQRGLRLPSGDRRGLRQSALREFLDFLGRHVIPRQSVRLALSTPGEQRKYLIRIQWSTGAFMRPLPTAIPRGPQGHAPSPDAKPQALSPARRAPAVGRVTLCKLTLCSPCSAAGVAKIACPRRRPSSCRTARRRNRSWTAVGTSCRAWILGWPGPWWWSRRSTAARAAAAGRPAPGHAVVVAVDVAE